jgi:hypothetical protein
MLGNPKSRTRGLYEGSDLSLRITGSLTRLAGGEADARAREVDRRGRPRTQVEETVTVVGTVSGRTAITDEKPV